MNKNELFDKCMSRSEQLLREHKLYIIDPYRCKAQHYFTQKSQIHSGITVSTVEGEAGIVSRAWGVVFIDCDRPIRCTKIHNSYYGESIALAKLLKEFDDLNLKG